MLPINSRHQSFDLQLTRRHLGWRRWRAATLIFERPSPPPSSLFSSSQHLRSSFTEYASSVAAGAAYGEGGEGAPQKIIIPSEPREDIYGKRKGRRICSFFCFFFLFILGFLKCRLLGCGGVARPPTSLFPLIPFCVTVQ